MFTWITFRGISQKIQRKSSELVKVGRQVVGWQVEIVYHPTEVEVYFIKNSRGTVVLMVGLSLQEYPCDVQIVYNPPGSLIANAPWKSGVGFWISIDIAASKIEGKVSKSF